MRTTHLLGAATALLFLAGCGGGGGHHGGGRVGQGEVTGLVSDLDGNPVRNATVYVDGSNRQTTSDASGAYVLRDVPAQDFDIRATATFGGVTYRGVNLGRVYDDESTPNVNVTVYPESSLTSLQGTIRGADGRPLRGARVFAKPTSPDVRSSESTLTDNEGDYVLEDLAVGVEYRIVASSTGFGDSATTKTIASGASDADRTVNLSLSGETTTAPAAPTNVVAVAITSDGASTTRSPRRAAAIEGVRRLRDPKRAARLAKGKIARDTPLGSPISIDVTWDEGPTNSAVLPTGFVIFRNETAGTDNGYLLADPLASLFSDADGALQVGQSYTYTLEAVSTGFREGDNIGRSPLSAAATAVPLDDLIVNLSSTTLSWNAVPGAARYTVYTYASYPTLNSADNLVGAPVETTGTSVAVTNPGFFYLVVGENANDTAETYSDIVTLQN